jgi:hypothetical protein
MIAAKWVSRVAVLLVGMSVAVVAHSETSGTAAADSLTISEPIALEASTVGRFAKGYSWKLAVSAEGEATLQIDSYPERVRRSFRVAPERLAELRDAITRERFFDLEPEYGENVPDGSRRTLAITQGGRTHTVCILFLMNWVRHDPERLRDPARALRVFGIVRGWFDDAEAVDLREYDGRVLDAVARTEEGTSAPQTTGVPPRH